MRGLRFDRLLSGAALALPLSVVLAIPASNAQANTQTPAAIESAVPMPETTTLAPPTASDAATPSGTEGIGSSTETAPAETTGTTTPAETTTAPATATPAPADTATAAPEAPPPDPMASLDPADRPIAERIRDMLPKADRTYSSRKERLAVEAFYQKRNYAPVWFERGALSARTNAAIARIHASAADGLIPAEYKIPEMTAASPDAQADAELRLTATLITFTRHLQAGRFPYARMGGEIMYPQEPPDVTGVAQHDRRSHQRRRRDRHVQPAATGLSRAQGQARGAARFDRRRDQGRAHSGRTDHSARHRRRARSAAAPAAQRGGRRDQSSLRRSARSPRSRPTRNPIG